VNHPHKYLLAAGLLAGLSFATGAQTPPAGAGPMAGAEAREHQHGRIDAAVLQERMAKRQAQFKHKLQITPAQEGAWSAYTAAIKPSANWQRPERSELEKLTTPERIDRMRAMHAARAAEMDRRGEATKTFYATLSPDQKKVFDAARAPGQHARHHEGHGHHRG
jgi:hypothetical protein